MSVLHTPPVLSACPVDRGGVGARHRRPQRQYENTVGGSLVEVIIALFIIVAGVLPVLWLCIGAGLLNRQAQIQTAAYSAARQQLEALRAQNFDSRAQLTATQMFPLPADITSQFPQSHMTGLYSVTSLRNTLQQVTVQVAWKNGAAPGYTKDSSVRLTTLIAKETGR
jgi:Tfp pilus assembly protein PilV